MFSHRDGIGSFFPSHESGAKLIKNFFRLTRLEKASNKPEELTQEAIIDNLDPKEWERLSRVRNIGIAVRIHSPPFEWHLCTNKEFWD